MKHGGPRRSVAGAEAAELYTTYGFPPELFETLAAEHNLAFDWARLSTARWSEHGVDLAAAGKRVELFTAGPLDALKKALHGTEFLGYETTEAEATDRRHHRAGSTGATSSTKSATSSRSPSCSIARRSTAKSAARSATRASSSAPAFASR